MSKGMKLSSFATNRQAELHGVWVDAPMGLRLLIARANNANYLTFMQTKGKNMKTPIQASVDAAIIRDEMTELVRKGAAVALLLGWENLLDDDEKPIPYSSQAAYDAFVKCPDFLDMVIGYANEVDRYRESKKEEDVKNS